jgi:hypothetical protein
VQRTIVLSIALVSTAATAQAQAPATPLGEFPCRLSIGETVFVTNQAGKTVKGNVLQLSDLTLVLQSGPDDPHGLPLTCMHWRCQAIPTLPCEAEIRVRIPFVTAAGVAVGACRE